jgi:N6-adenosine-specific RNA methylase IME4
MERYSELPVFTAQPADSLQRKYGVILADPPWRYSNTGTNGAAEKHYPTMSMDELHALPVGAMAHDDSVLLLWATWPMLPSAIGLMTTWGFDYISGFPWVKLASPPAIDLFGEMSVNPFWGIGFWARGCSEPIIIGRKGKPMLPAKNFLGLLSETMQHSRKPDSIYHYAESLQGPYLELFARRPRAGWDSFGNQAENSIDMTAYTHEVI